MAPPAPLERLVARVRAHLRRAALLEGVVVALTGVAVGLALGILGARLGLRGLPLALVPVLLGGAAVLFALGRYGWILARALDRPTDVAGWIDDVLPGDEAAVRFRTALEVARDRGLYGESEELADLTRAHAEARAAHVDPAALVRKETAPAFRPRVYTLGGAAAVLALLAILMPAPRDTLGAALAALGTMDNPLAPPPPEPRFDDIRLSYRYPAYANRAPTTLVTPDGAIHALPGTEVIIETRARERLTQATLIVSHGDEDGTRVAVQVDGRSLRTALVVSRGGRYRFHVETEDGQKLEERRGRPIELELDAPPEVSLLEPKDSPLEVNEQDRITLEIDAKDDFALGEARVAWRVLGTTREGRAPLDVATRGERRRRDRGTFDLSGLALRPGDRVAYSVEVVDNDTVNGPKVGASETKELRIYSKEAHHREVLAQAEKALDELVHVLGDNLESSFAALEDTKAYDALLARTLAIVERARAANTLLREAVTALQKDPLGQKAIATAFETARKDLARDTRNKAVAVAEARAHFEEAKRADERRARNVSSRQGEMVAALEKNVVYLADLLNDQRMLDAEALTKALRTEQENLRKALEAYKAAPDDAQRKLLMQAIQDIKKRVQEITAELSKLRGSIPTDLMNPEAMEERDQLADMDKVQQMIEEGDLDGAMKQLEKMLTGTERMLSEMQQGRQELGSREYSEVTEKAREMWKDLEALAKEQGQLGQKIDQYAQKMQDKMKDRLGNADSFVAKQLKRLEQAGERLKRAEPALKLTEGDGFDLAERRVEDTRRALQAKDFGAAREAVVEAIAELQRVEMDATRRMEQALRFGDMFGSGEEVAAALQEVQQSRPQVEQVLQDLDALMPSPDELMSKQERSDMQRLGERQQALEQRARGVKKQLDELAEQVPVVGEGTREMLDEASQGMGQSSQGLGKGDAPGAMGGHQKAMDALGRLQDALEQMAKGGSGSGGGVPLPFGPGQSGGGDEGGESFDPRSREKVEIPKPEQYKVPAEFREDILKAAKQNTAEAYKEAVRRYYEEIVK